MGLEYQILCPICGGSIPGLQPGEKARPCSLFCRVQFANDIALAKAKARANKKTSKKKTKKGS